MSKVIPPFCSSIVSRAGVAYIAAGMIAIVATIICITHFFTAVTASPPSLFLFPASGYTEHSYQLLLHELNTKIELYAAKQSHDGRTDRPAVCVAHSTNGAEHAFSLPAVELERRCQGGLILYGAAPSAAQLEHASNIPLMVLSGTLDGVVPTAHFALSRHVGLVNARSMLLSHGPASIRQHCFIAIPGAAHHSIVEDHHSALVTERDLRPTLGLRDTIARVTDLAADFVWRGLGSVFLKRAIQRTVQIASPLVAALELEGSSALGSPACNSDYPTNPTCQYPKYPDHSLPPGPNPPPSPPLPATCICGSKWITIYANSLIAGFDMSPRPDATVLSNDAFHNVSDVHPFHLPHIFNTCDPNLHDACELNITTVTMPVLKAGPLFPFNNTLSAYELKTKVKSRQAIWAQAGLGPGSPALDKNASLCKDVNQLAYDWALDNADPTVRDRFLQVGEPFVMVDDVEAPIGPAGPTWIERELVYTRVPDAARNGNGSHITIQSWSFVVANTNEGHLPWYAPVGMHYCKFLSPARAMEWIYLEGLRSRLSLSIS